MTQTPIQYTFIWDLDGTLFDSYDEIIGCTMAALEEYGVHRDRDDVYKESIKTSVTTLLRKTAEENGFSFQELNHRFHEIHEARYDKVKLAPNAKEILSWLTSQGIANYVFTHRESSMNPALEHTGILSYFGETIGMDGTFPRKPAPDGLLYLIGKYNLDKEHTFYVGDRTLDMACARNAGIKCIFFRPSYSVGAPDGTEDYLIHDLMDIKDLLLSFRTSLS